MDRRRDVWLHPEIMALLKLLKEKQIADLMDSKKFRTTDIFKSLEKDMNKNGIMRDAKQIQIKYKSLKQNYNNARRALSQSGAGTKVKCPYFDELQEIFGHRPISIQIGVDSANITQNENSGTLVSNLIDLDMYDNIPDPFDGAVPGTSRDVGVMPSKIKNSTNVDNSIVDNNNNNSDNEVHKSTNTIDKTSNIDKNINISNDNTSKVNNNNESNNETKPKKIEMNIKKEKFHTHSLQSKKRQSFSQTFDKCVDKIISSNTEQIKTVLESNNKMMMLIMEKEKEMLQDQTQLLLQQLNTCQSSYTEPYSFSAFNFPTNFVGQPRFQQFSQSNFPKLETISNQSLRFIKIPLSTVEAARKISSPKLVSSSAFDNSQSNIMNISSVTELSCDNEKAESNKENNEKQE